MSNKQCLQMFQISEVCENIWNVGIYCNLILCTGWHYRWSVQINVTQKMEIPLDYTDSLLINWPEQFGKCLTECLLYPDKLVYLNNPYYISKSWLTSLLRVFGINGAQVYIKCRPCGKCTASCSEHPLRLHFRSEELRARWKLIKNVLAVPLTHSLSVFLSLHLLHKRTLSLHFTFCFTLYFIPLTELSLLQALKEVSFRLTQLTQTVVSLPWTDAIQTGTRAQRTYRVVCLGSDGADRVCVPDDQVGIRAHGNPALTRVQVQDFGCVGAGYSHKHVLVHFTCSLGRETSGKHDIQFLLD